MIEEMHAAIVGIIFGILLGMFLVVGMGFGGCARKDWAAEWARRAELEHAKQWHEPLPLEHK